MTRRLRLPAASAAVLAVVLASAFAAAPAAAQTSAGAAFYEKAIAKTDSSPQVVKRRAEITAKAAALPGLRNAAIGVAQKALAKNPELRKPTDRDLDLLSFRIAISLLDADEEALTAARKELYKALTDDEWALLGAHVAGGACSPDKINPRPPACLTEDVRVQQLQARLQEASSKASAHPEIARSKEEMLVVEAGRILAAPSPAAAQVPSLADLPGDARSDGPKTSPSEAARTRVVGKIVGDLNARLDGAEASGQRRALSAAALNGARGVRAPTEKDVADLAGFLRAGQARQKDFFSKEADKVAAAVLDARDGERLANPNWQLKTRDDVRTLRKFLRFEAWAIDWFHVAQERTTHDAMAKAAEILSKP